MILAAGRGQRLRPLTDSLPKPLVKVGHQSLIEYHLQNLSNIGVKHIVINISYLSDLIEQYINSHNRFDFKISYSRETQGALGTAGGILNALSLFQSDEFIIVNSDVYTDYNFAETKLSKSYLAHLILIANPEHNTKGDYNLADGVLQHAKSGNTADYTFSGIGKYRKELFEDQQPGFLGLREVFDKPIMNGKISGEVFSGLWIDVGDHQRLEQARALFK